MPDQPLPRPSRAIFESEPTPVPEQVKGENALWYGRFTAWLLMPMPRSVLKTINDDRRREFDANQDKQRKQLARAKGRKKVELDRVLQIAYQPTIRWPGSWQEMVARFKWAERAEAFDKQETRRKAEAFALARDIQRLRELLASEDLYEKARELAQLGINSGTFVDKEGNEHSTQTDAKLYIAAATMFKEGKAQARAALEMLDKRQSIDFNSMSNETLIAVLREMILKRVAANNASAMPLPPPESKPDGEV